MFAYVCSFLLLHLNQNFKIDSPVQCKRSITYQDVCLLDGDRLYDTVIHSQITKMHLLLYIRSFAAYSMQHYRVPRYQP